MLFREGDGGFAHDVGKRPDAGGVEIRVVLGDREIGTHAERVVIGGQRPPAGGGGDGGESRGGGLEEATTVQCVHGFTPWSLFSCRPVVREPDVFVTTVLDEIVHVS